jgi:hypothetical protein
MAETQGYEVVLDSDIVFDTGEIGLYVTGLYTSRGNGFEVVDSEIIMDSGGGVYSGGGEYDEGTQLGEGFEVTIDDDVDYGGLTFPIPGIIVQRNEGIVLDTTGTLHNAGDDAFEITTNPEILDELSRLDVGNVLDLGAGDIIVVSEAFPVNIEKLASVIADSNFSSSDKWEKIIVMYEIVTGQNLRLVHKLREANWYAHGVFSDVSNGGVWQKVKLILMDSDGDMLVIGRAEIGNSEDLSVRNVNG